MTRGRLAIHGHFYQPPRIDPFSGQVPPDPAAAPFRDWNERITAECYRPNVEREALRRENVRAADEIVNALNERRILLAFEPVVETNTRRTAYYECLMRIRRADGSLASASQVIAAGFPELVATSPADYIARAIALGNDRPRLAAMAARLRAARDTLPLFDLDRYTRGFEAALERAWRETPEH